jgi:flagellar export protein FliJ
MSLKSLQKLRAQAVEALMMELAQITRTLDRAEQQYRDLEAELQQAVLMYDRQSSQGMTREVWLEWEGRMDSHRATLRKVRGERDKALEAWHRTKALLVEASQERTLLDRVADKRREAQRVDAGRQEQRIMDEAASRRYSTGKVNRS